MFQLHYFLFTISVVVRVFAVPPAVCRAEFRWDDCGKPAKPVMYYWKQGSRCEIGYWRGCLPNPNMFTDEYDCINTCVFVDRLTARSETEEPELETTLHENSTIVITDTTSNETRTQNALSNQTHDSSSTSPSINGSESTTLSTESTNATASPNGTIHSNGTTHNSTPPNGTS